MFQQPLCQKTAEPIIRFAPFNYCLLLVLFWLLLIAFYFPSLDHFFWSDDFVFLERSKIRSLWDVAAFFSVERNQYGLLDINHSYRPISTNVYFGFAQAVFGLNPSYYRWVNLILLGCNSILLSCLIVYFGLGRGTAHVLAFIYPITLVNFDCQLWISGTQELLWIFFFLASILSYFRWLEQRNPTHYLAAFALYVIALLSKEPAIALPLLLFFYHWQFRRDKLLGFAAGLAPLVMFNLLYLFWRSWHFDFPSEGPYAIKFGWFLGHNLRQFAQWSVEAILGSSHIVIVVAVALFLTWFAIGLSREWRSLAVFGLVWFCVTLLPVLFMPNHVYRYMLGLPFMGFLICLAAVLQHPVFQLRRRWVVCVVAVCYLALLYGHSRAKFSTEAALRERVANISEEIVEQLQAAYPTPSDNTDFFFLLPPRFPLPALLKNRGAVVRVVFDNPTLRAFPLWNEHQLRTMTAPRGESGWSSNGQLKENC